MTKFLLAAFALLAMGNAGNAASAVNLGPDTVTPIVTEGGDRSELTIAPGETVEFCANACFVTMPNGDREALTGSEVVEFSGGVATIR
jgi:hypothetical protein